MSPGVTPRVRTILSLRAASDSSTPRRRLERRRGMRGPFNQRCRTFGNQDLVIVQNYLIGNFERIMTENSITPLRIAFGFGIESQDFLDPISGVGNGFSSWILHP